MLLREFFGFALGNHALVGQVHFVAHQNFCNVGVGVLVNTVDPSHHAIKRAPLRNIKCYNNAVRLLVKRVGNGFETFLSCGVP